MTARVVTAHGVASSPNPERPDIVAVSEEDYFAPAGLPIDQHGTGALAQAVRLWQEALNEANALAAA